MKTRNLLITLGAAAFAAITINATAGNAYLSPRATGNQIATVAGLSDEVNSTVACAKTMTASPKSIQACVESGTMAGCKPVTIADAK
jgi:hypothetical protein